MKANGLPGDASVDVIEIIDDGTDAFGDRVPDTTIYDTGGPRWIGPAAAVALIAIVGYGVATSASDNGAPRVAPAPSTSIADTRTTTTAPITTTPIITTTVVAEPLVPYYAADPPRELTVQYANIHDPGDSSFGPSNYQFWATPGATATSGAWFSVESYAAARGSIFATDAYRVQAESLSIAISRPPNGVTLAQFNSAGRDTVRLTSFGLADADVVKLAHDIRIARGIVQFSDRAVVDGYEMVSTSQPWSVVLGFPIESLFYSDGDSPYGGINLFVAQRNPSNERGGDDERQMALRFLLTNATLFTVNGNTAVAGEVPSQEGSSLATWSVGDHILSVTGLIPLDQLVAIAKTVHEISAEEWSGVEFQAARHNSDNNFGNYDQSDAVPVSFGTDAYGDQWNVQVAVADFGGQKQIVWQWDGAGFGAQVEDVAKVTTVVSGERTYVLADLPRAIAATAQLQVLRDGLDPVLVPFADPDPDLDRTVAAYVFAEPTNYTAQIIGPDGVVLATWPAT